VIHDDSFSKIVAPLFEVVRAAQMSATISWGLRASCHPRHFSRKGWVGSFEGASFHPSSRAFLNLIISPAASSRRLIASSREIKATTSTRLSRACSFLSWNHNAFVFSRQERRFGQMPFFLILVLSVIAYKIGDCSPPVITNPGRHKVKALIDEGRLRVLYLGACLRRRTRAWKP